jgi:hypothetical protein
LQLFAPPIVVDGAELTTLLAVYCSMTTLRAGQCCEERERKNDFSSSRMRQERSIAQKKRGEKKNGLVGLVPNKAGSTIGSG